MKNAFNRLALALGILAAGAVSEAEANFTYALDDGTAEQVRGLGPSPGGSFFSVNEFSSNPAGSLITSISVAFGSPRQPGNAIVGTPVLFLLFRDANGLATPDNPILLASASTTIQTPDTNTFVTASINPTSVSGNFFAGVLISGLPQGGVFPMGFDTSTFQDRSYTALFSGSVGLGQLSSLGFDHNNPNSFVVNSNQFGQAADGNFLIRADGVAVPEPSSLALCSIAILGSMVIALVRRESTR
jgi:hypothetical protein